MLARLMLCSERGTMIGPWRDSSSVSFNKLPWFRPARKAGIIPALASRGHPSSLRLAAQDTALSRLERGFDSPRERHSFRALRAAKHRSRLEPRELASPMGRPAAVRPGRRRPPLQPAGWLA